MSRWHRSSDGPMPYGPPPSRLVEDEPGDTQLSGTPPSATPPAGPGLPPPPPLQAGGPLPVSPWAPPPGAYSSTVPGAQGLQYGRTLDRVMAYILDGFIISIPVVVITFALGAWSAASGSLREDGTTLVAAIIGSGLHLLYFVSFWTGSGQATPGMRVMHLRIGDAETGATPTVQQGLIRWLALGGIFQLLELVPSLLLFGGLVGFVWELVLLATTSSSVTKQGLHDRMANTAMVQPAGAQTPAVTCLVVFVVLFGVLLLGTVALLFLGAQVSSILSNVGTSI